MQFNTERTLVRFPEECDASDIFRNYTQDPEVTKYLVWRPHTCLQQTVEWISYCISICNTETSLKFIIFHKEDNQAIGMIDFRIDEYQANFGYVLARRYWSKGLMTEAMTPVLRYVFELPSIYRIWSIHDVDNPASGRVMTKLGLQYEGTMRRALIHPNISDMPRDCMLYSRVK